MCIKVALELGSLGLNHPDSFASFREIPNRYQLLVNFVYHYVGEIHFRWADFQYLSATQIR
jgi:hypothetical protein